MNRILEVIVSISLTFGLGNTAGTVLVDLPGTAMGRQVHSSRSVSVACLPVIEKEVTFDSILTFCILKLVSVP